MDVHLCVCVGMTSFCDCFLSNDLLTAYETILQFSAWDGPLDSVATNDKLLNTDLFLD